MLKKTIFLIFVALIIGACEADYTEHNKQTMSRFVGLTEDQLLDKFGIPTKEYDRDNGSKIMSWVFTGVVPSTTTTYNAFTGTWSNVGGASSFHCGINFFLNNERVVVSATTTGNASCKFN